MAEVAGGLCPSQAASCRTEDHDCDEGGCKRSADSKDDNTLAEVRPPARLVFRREAQERGRHAKTGNGRRHDGEIEADGKVPVVPYRKKPGQDDEGKIAETCGGKLRQECDYAVRHQLPDGIVKRIAAPRCPIENAGSHGSLACIRHASIAP